MPHLARASRAQVCVVVTAHLRRLKAGVAGVPGTNVGGYANTGWDLTANLVGCLTAGVLIWFRGRTAL